MGSLKRLLRLGLLTLLSGTMTVGATVRIVDAQAPAAPGRFLSAPSSADALDITRRHLRRDQAGAGLTERDIAESAPVARSLSRHNRATHVHLQQRFAGIDVLAAGVSSTVDKDGRLVAYEDRLVRDLESAVNTDTPQLSSLEAVAAAAATLDIDTADTPLLVESLGGAAHESRFAAGDISLDPISARLVYHRIGTSEVRLGWSVIVRTKDHRHWWQIVVDAETGTELVRYDWIAHDSYRVHALPLSNPDDGARTLEANVADVSASPFGWHDTDGIAGVEFTDTTGNNVRAQEDADGDDLGGATADGGPGLVFDFPFDPGQPPTASQSASITQLFYSNNVLHDVFHHYGFDEAAGNFQEFNYTATGIAADPVIADTLDGALLNNAGFGTPPDGQSPRMEMFLFLTSEFTIDSPPGLAGSPPSTAAAFGPSPPGTGISTEMVEALDPTDAAGPSPLDACSPLTNAVDVAGRIALIERGTCDFDVKVLHAQQAGAVAAVIYNNVGDALITMGGDDPTIAIPSFFIGQSDGVAIATELASNVVMATMLGGIRDSSFDNEIVAHEYMHGVSTRLTGGPLNVLCLQLLQSGGLGEGWSDFAALALTQKPGGLRTDSRTLGGYSLGNAEGPGLRRFPYSTDLGVNPLTLADLATIPEVHAIGEIWAIVLWEMYWNFVDTYGFDPDLVQGSGGNNTVFQLVVDAMKLQPCSPTFTSARDAILQADLLNHGGANSCIIWEAFARRGIGVGANAGIADNVVAQPSFAVPPECLDPIVQAPEQQRCIYAMNESLRKIMAVQGKNQLRCVTKAASNSLPSSAEVCLIADASGSLDKARDRADDQEQRYCTTAPDFGATDSLTVGDAGFAAELGLIHDVFGPNVDSAIVLKAADAEASRCQAKVTKAVGRCRDAHLKAFDRCKKSGLETGDIDHPTVLAACLTDDPRGRVAKACDAVSGAIATKALATKCNAPALDLAALFPACSTADPSEVAQCIEQVVSCWTCSALQRADALGAVIDCDSIDDDATNASCTPLP